MATETNPANKRKGLTARLDVEFALKSARLGVWEMDPVTNEIVWDERCRQLYGLKQDSPITYSQALQFIHPSDVGRVDEAVKRAMMPQFGGDYDTTYRTIGADDGVLRWVRFTGQVSFDEHQDVSRFAGVAQDVTKDELARQLTESEERYRTMVENAPVAIGVLRGDDLIIESANSKVLEILHKPASIIGKPWLEALPELEGTPAIDIIQSVYRTGVPFTASEFPAQLEKDGALRQGYYSFSYLPLAENGSTSGVLQVAIEITDQVLARQKITESEARFRALIEEAPIPTCLFVGRELRIDVANEAMIKVFGKGRSVIGKPLADALPELQGQHFLQTLDEVFTTGITYETKADRADLVVDGVLKTFYFDYTYKPLRNASGEVYAIMEMATDVTAEVLMKQKLQESEAHFRNLTDTVPAMIWETEPDGYCSYLNRRWYELTGQTKEEALGFGWLNATHPDDRDETSRLFLEANAQQAPFNALYRLRQADGTYRWSVDKASPRVAADGTYEGMIGTVVDIHEQVITSQQLADQQAQFKNVTNSSPTGLWLADGAGVVTYLNKTLLDWTGVPLSDLIGSGWANAIIDEDRERSVATFMAAVATRSHYEARFRLQKADGSVIWCQAAGDPYYDANGNCAGYAGFCMDIDELLRSREAIQHSETRFRSLLAQAPVALALMRGPDFIIDLANERALAIWDKQGEDVLDKPFAQALPAIYKQGFDEIVSTVFQTGKPFIANQMPVILSKNGTPQPAFVNVTIEPIRDVNGRIEAVLEVGYEVTDQVIAQQELAQQKIYLQNAIDIANLGTFSINLLTNVGTYSEAIRDWFGLDSLSQPMDVILNKVHSDDQALVEQALVSEEESRHDIVYRVEQSQTEGMRHLRSIGKRLISNGVATTMTGIIQDVTPQVLARQRIEEQVQQRTQELQATVRELERSNQNLQQFAYVASHDLQEPLRKIESFGNILSVQYASQLGDGIDYLRRMQSAATRMSGLIKDLLTYSRIATQQEINDPVPLGKVIKAALTDLDLVIAETGAVVTVTPLPTVRGDKSQLGQLFQNLLNNALKFRRIGVVPNVRITAAAVPANELPATVRPARPATYYYRIDVADNGIGFDEKYLDRIFQVFQRLHGRNEFAGTGIGLAICEKVAANHGGAISASSQPGQGATFNIYLPVTEANGQPAGG
ncbi:PAS domain-containing sensor histidine kinase [Fibrella aquatilis]|uniref:histidine kinase n=1 Tax=Fibrella aquatilis TaxID=2817059 RepID=A0A939G5K5_9BACT|nr:PAS domain S-box protein [Fibrella aquatilis]MBO0932296.1 PAS domain S-box protein [Fibrella aquatilis]